jgi:transcription factor IIIB subunit 2
MALDRGLSRGNKSSHLHSACLYIICRTEDTQHILLDFCDHVDADISVLARIYLRLARELCIKVPHTDPSLLIPRYAAKLDFGDRTNAVSNTALRIVQRMKRDWLNIGRRSSGLCGSALLFAARMHNFNRTIQQIVDVVKISKATIIRRLQEFETTPTAQLNMKEFDTIELEEEQDPPAFSKAKRMTKLAQHEESFNIEQIEREILETQKQIDDQLEKLHKPRGQLAK